MWTAIMLTVLLLWSVLVVAQKLLPKTAAQWRLKLATQYLTGLPSLANWLKPTANSGCGGGCDCPANTKNSTTHSSKSILNDGSKNASSNASKSATKNETTQAIKWR